MTIYMRLWAGFFTHDIETIRLAQQMEREGVVSVTLFSWRQSLGRHVLAAHITEVPNVQ